MHTFKSLIPIFEKLEFALNKFIKNLICYVFCLKNKQLL